MVKSTKSRHMQNKIYHQTEFEDEIVKVIEVGGSNMNKVRDQNGDEFYVTLPNKFRNFIYIRRGCYVTISPVEQDDDIKRSITSVLLEKHIKELIKDNNWPLSYSDEIKLKTNLSDIEVTSESENEDDQNIEQD